MRRETHTHTRMYDSHIHAHTRVCARTTHLVLIKQLHQSLSQTNGWSLTDLGTPTALLAFNIRGKERGVALTNWYEERSGMGVVLT